MSGLLEKGEHQIHLEPKVMDVLVCLARHQGEVVTRDMLLDEVWRGTIVSDDAITRCISELRTVFGDTDRERTYIRTIPRRGYMLLVPVKPLPNTKNNNVVNEDSSNQNNPDPTYEPASPLPLTQSHQLSRKRVFVYMAITVLFLIVLIYYSNNDQINDFATSSASEKEDSLSLNNPATDENNTAINRDTEQIDSLAVLPFANLSGEPEHEYFTDGLSEDIRNTLLTATHMRVAARTSSSVFKNKAMDVREIARQLNVDALLEGTVRIIDDKLRITTQLTDGNTGYSIWASSYERNLEDKVILQTEIAEQIVKQLAPSLENRSNIIKVSTTNVQAHDYYLLGRHHWHLRTAESLDQAEVYFQQALELDPDYALAYAGLADALLFQTIYGNRTIREIEQQAHDAIEKALNLDPGLAEAYASLGILLEDTGNMEASLEAYRKAIAIKPQYSMAQMWLGSALFKNYDAIGAYRHYAKALETDPLHSMVQMNYLNSLRKLGRYEEALETVERFYQTNPSEDLLKTKMAIQLELGKYNEVLTLAVGHTFSGKYKPYASEHVVDALIELQRFNEARQILSDNADEIEKWYYNLLQIKLALAEKDTNKLKQIGDYLISHPIDISHKINKACASRTKTLLYALAEYIDSSHEQANIQFNELQQTDSDKKCFLIEPEFALMMLLYHASNRLRIETNDTIGMQLSAQAREQLDILNRLGWKTPVLSSFDVILRYMMNDENGAIEAVQAMADQGWQPLGAMSVTPLFDELLGSEKFTANTTALIEHYRRVREQSHVIELAKLGL